MDSPTDNTQSPSDHEESPTNDFFLNISPLLNELVHSAPYFLDGNLVTPQSAICEPEFDAANPQWGQANSHPIPEDAVSVGAIQDSTADVLQYSAGEARYRQGGASRQLDFDRIPNWQSSQNSRSNATNLNLQDRPSDLENAVALSEQRRVSSTQRTDSTAYSQSTSCDPLIPEWRTKTCHTIVGSKSNEELGLSFPLAPVSSSMEHRRSTRNDFTQTDFRQSVSATSAATQFDKGMRPLGGSSHLTINSQQTSSGGGEKSMSAQADRFNSSNQASSTKKRRMPTNINNTERYCQCLTGCSRQYCPCFKALKYCNDFCMCQSVRCLNRVARLAEVAEAHHKIKLRENGQKIGCSCKKTECITRHCGCSEAGVECFTECRCKECKNPHGKRGGRDELQVNIGPRNVASPDQLLEAPKWQNFSLSSDSYLSASIFAGTYQLHAFGQESSNLSFGSFPAIPSLPDHSFPFGGNRGTLDMKGQAFPPRGQSHYLGQQLENQGTWKFAATNYRNTGPSHQGLDRMNAVRPDQHSAALRGQNSSLSSDLHLSTGNFPGTSQHNTFGQESSNLPSGSFPVNCSFLDRTFQFGGRRGTPDMQGHAFLPRGQSRNLGEQLENQGTWQFAATNYRNTGPRNVVRPDKLSAASVGQKPMHHFSQSSDPHLSASRFPGTYQPQAFGQESSMSSGSFLANRSFLDHTFQFDGRRGTPDMQGHAFPPRGQSRYLGEQLENQVTWQFSATNYRNTGPSHQELDRMNAVKPDQISAAPGGQNSSLSSDLHLNASNFPRTSQHNTFGQESSNLSSGSFPANRSFLDHTFQFGGRRGTPDMQGQAFPLRGQTQKSSFPPLAAFSDSNTGGDKGSAFDPRGTQDDHQ